MFALTMAGGAREAKGYTITQLTFEPSNEGKPAWSPDGSKIAFVSDRNETYEIYLMESNGSNQRRVTDSYEILDPPLSTVTYSTSPAWSPDGSKIAFEAGAQGVESVVSNIYILDVSDNTIRQFTRIPYSEIIRDSHLFLMPILRFPN